MNNTELTKKQEVEQPEEIDIFHENEVSLADLTEKPLAIANILASIESDNLVDNLSEDDLTKLGAQVIRDYDEDRASQREWEEESEAGRKLAEMIPKEKNKSFPWPNASNVVHPMIAIAAIQHNAHTFPNLIKGNQVVKGQINGADPDGQKQQLAKMLGEHDSHYILNTMIDWEENLDRSVIEEAIMGCGVQKIYHDPIEDVMVSEPIPPFDIVADFNKPTLRACQTITHRYDMYYSDIQEKVLAGIFSAVDIKASDNIGDAVVSTVQEDNTKSDPENPENKPHELLEQHCRYDLDLDGYAEPYIVTVHAPSKKILRIVACYDAETVFIKPRDGIARDIKTVSAFLKQGETPEGVIPGLEKTEVVITRVKRIEYFNATTFIPSLCRSWRGTGFAKLLGPVDQICIDMLNRLADAGTMQNLQGGFKSSTARVANEKSEISVRPGEWKPLIHEGNDIRKHLYSFNHSGPSPVLFEVLKIMIEAGKDISSTQDIMTGKMPGANTPVGTTLAGIDQALRMYTAIQKRKHKALTREFKMIRRLLRLHGNGSDGYQGASGEWMNALQPDIDGDGTIDVMPVCDPENVTKMQKIMVAEAAIGTAEAVAQMGGNVKELYYNYYEAIGLDTATVEKILPQESQPAPDSKAEIESQKLAQKQEEINQKWEELGYARHKAIKEMAVLDAEIIKKKAETTKIIAEAEAVELGPQMEQYKSQISDMEARNAEEQKNFQAMIERNKKIHQSLLESKDKLIDGYRNANTQGQSASADTRRPREPSDQPNVPVASG